MINIMSFIPGTFQRFTVLRRKPAKEVEGRRVDPPAVALTFSGVIQPVSEREQRLLPEGVRADDVIEVFSRSELFAEDGSKDQRGDVILYEGKCYRVFAVKDWRRFGYWKALAEGFVQ